MRGLGSNDGFDSRAALYEEDALDGDCRPCQAYTGVVPDRSERNPVREAETAMAPPSGEAG